MTSGKYASSDMMEDGESNYALGVLASTSVFIAGGQVEKWRTKGHGAGDEEEQSREGHEAEGF